MNEENVDYIIKKAIEHYGIEQQKIKAIEEMSELIQVLSKDFTEVVDQEHIIEELADVTIMILQLASFYGEEKVDKIIDKKLNKLHKRMYLERYENEMRKIMKSKKYDWPKQGEN